jgi:hypothetical protein
MLPRESQLRLVHDQCTGKRRVSDDEPAPALIEVEAWFQAQAGTDDVLYESRAASVARAFSHAAAIASSRLGIKRATGFEPRVEAMSAGPLARTADQAPIPAAIGLLRKHAMEVVAVLSRSDMAEKSRN